MAALDVGLVARAAYGLGASALTADEISINVSFGSGWFNVEFRPTGYYQRGDGGV